MNETEILNKIKTKLSKLGFTIFRNNVGAWRAKNGQYIKYGLCKGSSDLIGWKPIVVTQEMVGKLVAIFSAIEVKRPSKSITSDEQINFIKSVKEAGGIGVIAKSEDDLEQL